MRSTFSKLVATYEQITDTKHQYFEDALNIYREAFPSSERHPVEVIKQRIDSGKSTLIVGCVDRKVALMAMLWELKHTSFTLLDYLATKESYRGKGLATAFLSKTFARFNAKGINLILEVEDPKYGNNKEERAKRVSFFKQNGAKELTNVRYLLPPLQGAIATEMILLISPGYTGETIDAQLLKAIITQIYSEVYSRSRNDDLLNSFLYKIQGSIRLD
jgi:GNAT superfamily N-acetyltransferase